MHWSRFGCMWLKDSSPIKQATFSPIRLRFLSLCQSEMGIKFLKYFYPLFLAHTFFNFGIFARFSQFLNPHKFLQDYQRKKNKQWFWMIFASRSISLFWFFLISKNKFYGKNVSFHYKKIEKKTKNFKKLKFF